MPRLPTGSVDPDLPAKECHHAHCGDGYPGPYRCRDRLAHGHHPYRRRPHGRLHWFMSGVSGGEEMAAAQHKRAARNTLIATLLAFCAVGLVRTLLSYY